MKKALLLDVYGTLLDLSAPVSAHLDGLGPQAARLSDMWRAKQLEYAWVANFSGNYRPFSELTERALSHTLETLGLFREDLSSSLLEAYWNAVPFGEVSLALTKLSVQEFRLIGFSNANCEMLHRALESAGLTSLLDDIWSIDRVEVFKPDKRAYQNAADRLKDTDICFASSNSWDVEGAKVFGWRSFWINRKGLPFDHTSDVIAFGDLDELAKHLS